MPSHLVEHSALHGEDAPIGLVGRMRAGEHVERLLVVADIGERAPVGAEQAHMFRILDRGLLEHGHGLGALAISTQSLRVFHRRFGIARVGAVAFAPCIRRALPIALCAGCGGGEGAGRFRWLDGLATGKRNRERTRTYHRNETLERIERPGTH